MLEITDTFFRAIRRDTWPEHQNLVDEGTMAWWSGQSAEARAQALYNDEATDFDSAMVDMYSFLIRAGATDFFGNGPEFDCSVINNALTGLGLSPLHNPNISKRKGFACQQSVRTVVLLGRIVFGDCIKYRPFKGIQHHALDDAIHEAQIVIDTLQRFVDLRRLSDDLRQQEGEVSA